MSKLIVIRDLVVIYLSDKKGEYIRCTIKNICVFRGRVDMKIEDFPYLREISVDYKHHIGGYMGGGSWAITTKRDSNGDRARIILGRGTSYRSMQTI